MNKEKLGFTPRGPENLGEQREKSQSKMGYLEKQQKKLEALEEAVGKENDEEKRKELEEKIKEINEDIEKTMEETMEFIKEEEREKDAKENNFKGTEEERREAIRKAYNIEP